MIIELLEFLVIIVLVKIILILRKRVKELESSKISQSTKYGMIMEKFAPFMKKYPYNPEGFRFIGSPIDGIQFEDDKIIFVEFKASNSRLSEKQKKIRELLAKKKVFFEEFKMK